ncbi:MAG: hypothetical protein K2X32_14550, partial [Phycisphaerales bacterium]|nr:hypothetical protein [Phycisphaerales bacterium]
MGAMDLFDPMDSHWPDEYTLTVTPIDVVWEFRLPCAPGECNGATEMRTVPGFRFALTQNPAVFQDWPASKYTPDNGLASAVGRWSWAVRAFEDKRIELATRGAGANYSVLTPPDYNQRQYRDNAVAKQAFLDRVKVYLQGPLVNPKPEVLARYDRAAGYPVPVNFTDAAARDAVVAAGLRPSLRLINEAAVLTQAAVVNANVPQGAEAIAQAAYQAVTAARPAATSPAPAPTSATTAASAPASSGPSASYGTDYGSAFASVFTPARSSATPATLSPASSS